LPAIEELNHFETPPIEILPVEDSVARSDEDWPVVAKDERGEGR
jgi:hypothetical protein